METLNSLNYLIVRIAAITAFIACLTGCLIHANNIRDWEKSGNISLLSEVARNKSERPRIRKMALQSLARLNWEPSNDERLQVYSLFASKNDYQEASILMQTLTAEKFTEIDKKIVYISSLLNKNGHWSDRSKARMGFDDLRMLNGKAVTISLCQQVAARPLLQNRILLLAIKLGIDGSEDELAAVLFVYGNKSMAEDYLNCGSEKLYDGARRWVAAHGYRVSKTHYGSHRSKWGRF